MIKFLKGPSFYLALWILYNLQGIVYGSGVLFSQLLLFMILVISLFHLCMTISIPKPPFMRGLNLLVLLFSLYGIPYLFSGIVLNIDGFNYPSYYYLKSIYSSLLPIYSFYYYSRKGTLTHRVLSIWIVVFLTVAVLQFFRYKNEALLYYESLGSSLEEVTNNQGYLFLSLIPAMLIYKNKPIFQYAGIATCLSFVVLSMKRGAILIGALLLLLFMYHNFKASSHKYRTITFMLSIVLVILGYFFIVDVMMESDYFQNRIQASLAGDSSNRSILYGTAWNYFISETNAFHSIFGYGPYGTARELGFFAHCDWLEILLGQGLIGVIVYLIFFVLFLKTINMAGKHKKTESDLALNMVFLIWIMKSIFSAGYADMSVYLTSVLGYYLARYSNPVL